MNDNAQGKGRERRRHARTRLVIGARIEAPPRAPRPCQVYDMSPSGALMDTHIALRLGQPVVLHIDELDALAGHVVRVTSTVIAIGFDSSVDAAAIEDFIARHTEKSFRAALDVASPPA